MDEFYEIRIIILYREIEGGVIDKVEIFRGMKIIQVGVINS